MGGKGSSLDFVVLSLLAFSYFWHLAAIGISQGLRLDADCYWGGDRYGVLFRFRSSNYLKFHIFDNSDFTGASSANSPSLTHLFIILLRSHAT